MGKMFLRSKMIGLFFLMAVLGMLSFSTETKAMVSYTIMHVDEFNNDILPTESGNVPNPQWRALNSRVTATLYNAGQEYELMSVQSNIPFTHFIYDHFGPRIWLEGIGGPQFKLVYRIRSNSNSVHTPSTPNMPHTPSSPPPAANGGGYVIEFVDASGNKLIPDTTGSAPDNTWLKLNKEFKASLYDPGSQYMISEKQAYDASRYIYGFETKILITQAFNKYRIVCYRKEEPAVTPRSSGGGGDSGGRRAPLREKEGWILAGEKNWTYYSGTSKSMLKKGWHKDPQDGFWYYLDVNTGAMYTGWHLIDGKWYFFNEYTPIWTWEQRSDGEWYFKRIASSRPYGSMYKNEMTPDGFRVGEDGSRRGEGANR